MEFDGIFNFEWSTLQERLQLKTACQQNELKYLLNNKIC